MRTITGAVTGGAVATLGELVSPQGEQLRLAIYKSLPITP